MQECYAVMQDYEGIRLIVKSYTVYSVLQCIDIEMVAYKDMIDPSLSPNKFSQALTSLITNKSHALYITTVPSCEP